MDFRYTEEQLMIQDVARRIAQEKIAPSAEHHDRTGEFPLENIRTLGENGLMGIEVPAEYGGAGMDPVSYVLAMVEIAAADAAHSTIVSVNNSLFCNGILQFGTEAQKQKYVRAIADCGSVSAKAPISLPSAIARTYFCFCASVPNCRMPLQNSELLTETIVEWAASAAAISTIAST